MKMSLVFDPDPTLGHDPNDKYKRPYRIGEFFDTDDAIDVVLLVRQWDDRFEGGNETQVWTTGAWENVDPEQIEQAVDVLSGMPE